MEGSWWSSTATSLWSSVKSAAEVVQKDLSEFVKTVTNDASDALSSVIAADDNGLGRGGAGSESSSESAQNASAAAVDGEAALLGASAAASPALPVVASALSKRLADINDEDLKWGDDDDDEAAETSLAAPAVGGAGISTPAVALAAGTGAEDIPRPTESAATAVATAAESSVVEPDEEVSVSLTAAAPVAAAEPALQVAAVPLTPVGGGASSPSISAAFVSVAAGEFGGADAASASARDGLPNASSSTGPHDAGAGGVTATSSLLAATSESNDSPLREELAHGSSAGNSSSSDESSPDRKDGGGEPAPVPVKAHTQSKQVDGESPL